MMGQAQGSLLYGEAVCLEGPEPGTWFFSYSTLRDFSCDFPHYNTFPPEYMLNILRLFHVYHISFSKLRGTLIFCRSVFPSGCNNSPYSHIRHRESIPRLESPVSSKSFLLSFKHVYACACTCIYEGQKITSSVIPRSAVHLPEGRSFTVLGPPCLPPSHHAWLLPFLKCGFRGWSSGPHASKASILQTELSPCLSSLSIEQFIRIFLWKDEHWAIGLLYGMGGDKDFCQRVILIKSFLHHVLCS